MIGYYVHHVGRGHQHRAEALAATLQRRGETVTGLSSLGRPRAWTGDWIHLPSDDDEDRPHEETAHGQLHWAPLGSAGLRSRMAGLSSWIDSARPDLMVVDVSVEVSLLARLHGVPVLGVVLPGRRDDPAHTLAFGVADALVSFWPAHAHDMAPGLSAEARAKLTPVGGLSRHDTAPERERSPSGGRRAVVLLLGAGGHEVTAADVEDARASTPDWVWTVLDGSPSTWLEDPSSVIAGAEVLVIHAGQNAVAEAAAARRPAVVLPQARPHREQVTTASVLRAGWPAVVLASWPRRGWSAVLEKAARLDGQQWSGWCDGRAAERFADVALRARLPGTVAGAR